VLLLLAKHVYDPHFKAAFPNETAHVTPVTYVKSFEDYEATQTTAAFFDRYLAGDLEKLHVTQKKGLWGFMDAGCVDSLGQASWRRADGEVRRSW
jgi:cytochrome c peroxidase